MHLSYTSRKNHRKLHLDRELHERVSSRLPPVQRLYPKKLAPTHRDRVNWCLCCLLSSLYAPSDISHEFRRALDLLLPIAIR